FWYFSTHDSGSALASFDARAKRMAAERKPKTAGAEEFRATVCATSPCILVEAGGLSFVFGAGEGAAEGMQKLGLMRGDIDGVVLDDLTLDSIAGLPALREASFAAGRSTPLAVFGPEGVVPVVDGTNLLLSGSAAPEAAKLAAGNEGEDQGIDGKIVFDSGVVTIRGFATAPKGRLYRVDFGGKSLIVAGCGATSEDVARAAHGTRQPFAVVGAASETLRKAEREAARAAGLAAPEEAACLTAGEAAKAMSEGKIAAGLLAPLYPQMADSLTRQVWRDEVFPPKGVRLAPAGPGAVLDLSRAEPSITLPH
ncbi:MAG TPA: hypothetical protein VG942_19075, partial [Hyphomonadaceae bacterium]|nr:hypothetical protein [Hyphomonadaceae bacterium]